MNTEWHKRSCLLVPVLLAFGLGIAGQEASAPRRLFPVDEASKDASFAKFRSELQQAVKEKDAKFLLGVLDPEIKASFGGDLGGEDFRRMWEPEKPESEVWGALEEVLSRGAIRIADDPPSFAAPYYCGRWPEAYDPFDYGVVVGKNVALRKEASLDAPVLTRLSFDILRVIETLPEGPYERWTNRGWARVRTLGGKEGYVSLRYLGNPTGHRAYFQKKNGAWRITIFVAGD